MKSKSRRFMAVDICYILMIVVPLVVGLVLKILTTPASEGISISGALVYFTVPMPLQDLPITEAQVNSLLVLISIFGVCLFMTHGLTVKAELKRQHLIEWALEKVNGMIEDNMGEFFTGYGPFIASIIVLSAFSSLLALCGLYAPTSDINIVAGWAILVFILITYYKLKS